MTEGTVKFFNAQKEFGFIKGDDEKDYFVHISQVKEGTQLAEGDRVSFDAVQGDKGPKAENVQKIEGGSEPKAEEPSQEPADEEPANEENSESEEASAEGEEEQPDEEKKEEAA